MKHIINKLFFCFFIVIIPSVYSRVELKIEKTEKSKDTKTGDEIHNTYLKEPFKLKVIISDEKDCSQKPNILGIERFRVYNFGTARYSSLINHSFSSSIIYSYDVVSEKEGDFEIGPAEVGNGGNLISSNNKIKVHVKERGNNPFDVKNGTGYEFGENSQDKVFCELSSDKKSVVLGEPLFITAKFFCTNSSARIGEIEMPSMSDFLVKEVNNSSVPGRVIKDNILFHTVEKSVVVIPTTAGIKGISPFRIVYQFPVNIKSGGFGIFANPFSILNLRYKNKVVASNKLSIKVEDLPPYNGRVDAVGEFNKFEASLGTLEALINEPITLTLNIGGKGNFDQVGAPKLSLSEPFKYYESKAEFNDDSSFGKLSGTKQFEYILQVGQEGRWELPFLEFTYFDLNSKKYKTLKSNKLSLDIKAPAGGSNQNDTFGYKSRFAREDPAGKIEEFYEKDINFIEEDVGNSTSTSSDSKRHIPWWLFIVLLFLPILFVFKKLLFFLRRKIGGNYSSKNFLSLVKQKLQVMKKNNDVTRLYSLFLDFFAQKFNVSKNELSEDLIGVKLKNKGWLEHDVDKFLEYLNICASQAFSSSRGVDADKSFILASAEKWFLKLNEKKFDS